jgi:nicotinic acid mononucleotide adenylyltransferase
MIKTTLCINNLAVNLYNNQAIERVRDRAHTELNTMSQLLNMPLSSYPFPEIYSSLNAALNKAAFLLDAGMINPWIDIRKAPVEPKKSAHAAALCIGVYPVAADPFHWAHLLIGLAAIAEYRLDRIIYLISGDDPRKPLLTNAAVRHQAGKKVLEIFNPFFDYSSIALGNNLDGETNLFRLLALNPEQKIDAYYMVGSDHFRRINPKTNLPDTVAKLEKNITSRIYGYNDVLHSISVIFIERGLIDYSSETFLNVSFMPAVPITASSTMIREALQGSIPMETLALMPFSAFTCTTSLNPCRYLLYRIDQRKGYLPECHSAKLIQY